MRKKAPRDYTHFCSIRGGAIAMIREIVLDTETTGLDPRSGDRVVEIGCVELINHVATGNTYQVYINPQTPMSSQAFAVHGLGDEFLKDKPLFHEICDGFLHFIADSPLIIHNASFDMKFLNHELKMLERDPLHASRAVDTLMTARKKFPGAPASLDALCKRFKIDNTNRSFHGALLDAQLLALVYLELIGGRQPGFIYTQSAEDASTDLQRKQRPVRTPRPHPIHAEELAAYSKFMQQILKN